MTVSHHTKTTIDFYDLVHKRANYALGTNIDDDESLNKNIHQYVFNDANNIDYFLSVVSPRTHSIKYIETPWNWGVDVCSDTGMKLMALYNYRFQEDATRVYFGELNIARANKETSPFVRVRDPDELDKIAALGEYLIDNMVNELRYLSISVAFILMYVGVPQVSIRLYRALIKNGYSYYVQTPILKPLSFFNDVVLNGKVPLLYTLPDSIICMNGRIPNQMRKIQYEGIREVFFTLHGIEEINDVYIIEKVSHMHGTDRTKCIGDMLGSLVMFDNKTLPVIEFIANYLSFTDDEQEMIKHARKMQYLGSLPPDFIGGLEFEPLDEQSKQRLTKILKIFIGMTNEQTA